MGKQTLELVIGKHKLLPDACGHTTVFKGVGKSKPDFSNLGERIAKRVTRKQRQAAGGRKPKVSAPEVAPGSPTFQSSTLITRNRAVGPTVTVPSDSPGFNRLVNGADVLQTFMVGRQFEHIVDMILKDRESVMRDGLAYVPEDTKKGVQTQIDVLGELRTELTTQLPVALKKAVQANPGMSVNELLNQLLSATMEELGGFLNVSDGYQSALLQWKDPLYRDRLRAINFLMREQFRLFLTGNLDSQQDGSTSAPFIPTQSFKVGMAILTAFAGMGLGTIPGQGPLGLHLLMIPKDMFDFATATGPLFLHESVHQVVADLIVLLKEMQQRVADDLKAAAASGRLPFKKQSVQIGKFKKSTLEVVTKVFADWINEIIADLVAALNAGPAFGYSMMQTFPALGIRGKKVSESDQKLRVDSVYSIVDSGGGKMTLEMEAHPIDYIRLYILAAAYDLLASREPAQSSGAAMFADAANLCRKQADLCVGKVPEFMTWSDASGKKSTVISVATADLIAAAPLVVKTLIFTKFAGLNNHAFGDIVMWNAKREAKVQHLAQLIRSGKSDPPTDIGSLHPNYVFAAGAAAMWQESDKSGEALTQFTLDCSRTVVEMTLKLEQQMAA